MSGRYSSPSSGGSRRGIGEALISEVVVSPYAKRHAVDHDLMDTSSLVRWVESTYHLPPLGVWGNRDVNAGDLRGAFDFSAEDQP